MKKYLEKFKRDENGVALVEFAIFLPLFLLSLAIIIEFSRIFFSFQGANVGVRDAARYIARTTESNICLNHVGTVPVEFLVGTAGAPNEAYLIVERTMKNEMNLLPVNVFLISTTTYIRCQGEEGDYRQDRVPIAEVVSVVDVVLPLRNVFGLLGITFEPIRATVRDQSRVFGV